MCLTFTLKTSACQTFFNLPYFPVNIQTVFISPMKSPCPALSFNSAVRLPEQLNDK